MIKTQETWIIRSLNKLTYFQKFGILSLLFAFSLASSTYYMIQCQNASIRHARLELKGMQYERALKKLMEGIPQHQWKTVSYLSGDTGAKNNLDTLTTVINGDFKYLLSLDQTLQDDLPTSPRDFQLQNLPNLKPSELFNQWNDLVNSLSTLTIEASNEKHEKLIASLRSLILYIGETSRLILDPTVQVNYFTQNLLWNLPKDQVLIPRIIVATQTLIDDKNVTPEEKAKLISLEAFLKNNLDDIQKDAKKALHNRTLAEKQNIKEKEKIEESLTIPLNNFFEASSEWAEIVENIVKSLHNPPPYEVPKNYLSVATKTLDANFSLWEAIAKQIEDILTLRIETAKRQRLISILASFISAIIGWTLGYYIIRQISDPLTHLVEAAKKMAQGDLSTRVKISPENEMGQVGIAFNHMAAAFQEIIGRLQKTTIQLSTSTTEIASVAKQQESTILDQENATKQIATTAREISNTAKEFAKTMNEVSNNAEQTSSLASSGKEGLRQMETIMGQLVEASRNIAAKLAILNEKASNITSVITTITKVADQTNLLSLNAAIEAEKAGEHGRTFSVIAKEIRRLADQTGNATLDIEKMVTEMVSAVSAGVMSVDKFAEEINTGVAQVGAVGEQLSKIIEQVQRQTSSFENVNKGMQGQSQGAEQINKSINQLSVAAQQASQSIHQFHTAIEQLNFAAKDMQDSITRIKH